MGRGGETLIEDWNPQFAVTGVAPSGKVGRVRKPMFLPQIRPLFSVGMRLVGRDVVCGSVSRDAGR
jgi:hypothetical protein